MTQPKRRSQSPIKPYPLDSGSRIALIAPAFSFDRALMKQGQTFLTEKFGIQSIYLDSVFETAAYFAGSDQRRVDELFHWLTESSTTALLAIRGGYGLSHLYPELIARLKKRRGLKPKIVAGYSDLTLLLNGLYQDLGWVTFHAPVLVGRPFREPLELELRTFSKSLFSSEPLGVVTDKQVVVLNPGVASGPIVGGCLSLVVSSLGTSYELQTSGKVLFLEDVDEKPYRLDRMLTQLLHAGKLDRIKGLIFGQMVNCEPSPESRDPNKTSAIEAVRLAIGAHLRKRNIPAIYHFPAGHGSPQITFPIGARVEVRAAPRDPGACFLEAGCRKAK